MAPIALAATVAAIYVVAHSQLAAKHSHAKATHVQSTGVVTTRGRSGKPNRPPPRFYVIRPGDTLSGIAVKTHVPLSQLELLNPGVNPSALQTGQRLRLRG